MDGQAEHVNPASWPKPLAEVVENVSRRYLKLAKNERPANLNDLISYEDSQKITKIGIYPLPPEAIELIKSRAREQAKHVAQTLANGIPGVVTADHIVEPEPEDHGDAWEDPQDQKTKPGQFALNLISSPTFAANNYRPSWLVKRVLVANQPAIIGGPRKNLKTSILIDLGVSLATATPFLDVFDVYHRVKVAIISGESGEFAIQETSKRICQARGVNLPDADIFWGFKLPQLSDLTHLAALQEELEQHKIEVAIIDPLYLCLLAGISAKDKEASNLFDMGPLLQGISLACLKVGCTPILVHHTRKGGAKSFDMMDLEDLAFAGIQEFARQWLLVNRREAFKPDHPGTHRLWMQAGGSVGHSGAWGLDIEEGEQQDNFSGRKWDVVVRPASEIITEEENDHVHQKQRKDTNAVKTAADRILDALDKIDPNKIGTTKNKVKNLARVSTRDLDCGIQLLLDEGHIEEVEVQAAIGSKATRKCNGIRKKHVQECLPSRPCGP
jgi:hypothetical protein